MNTLQKLIEQLQQLDAQGASESKVLIATRSPDGIEIVRTQITSVVFERKTNQTILSTM